MTTAVAQVSDILQTVDDLRWDVGPDFHEQLMEDIYAEAVADSLSGVSANSITLTVGDELSGELAQFVAGEVSVDADDDTDE